MRGGGPRPRSRLPSLLVCAVVASALAGGCSGARRHRILTLFFDGVPAPGSEAVAPGSAAAGAAPPSIARLGGHGPYAARMCESCHESRLTNALVEPPEKLCYRCHDIAMTARFVHGPLASGGCTSCHDPHSSPYRYLLLSESDTFCFSCHAEADVRRSSAHEGVGDDCTRCHDAHMSDREHLLK